MRLNNKVAVVTGGSRGIGLATVERFLQEGALVILTAVENVSINYKKPDQKDLSLLIGDKTGH